MANPGGTAASGSARFAQEAKDAGLNPTQARELQRAVDDYLKKTDGVQTAANVIEYPGARLTVPLPGEERARDLGAQAAASCAYKWACVFSGPNLTGSRIDLYTCGVWTYIPWTGSNGSFDNNQTAGTKLGLKNTLGGESWNWPAHWIESQGVRWVNITHVNPCR